MGKECIEGDRCRREQGALVGLRLLEALVEKMKGTV
jgi:hypothetical protein